MTCIYNPDNQTQALLKKYEHVLGSYEAAYYVISQNNGQSLDFTPDGKVSQLYADLKASHGEDAAIRMKAMTYTKPFYDQYGDWTMGQGDPVILDQNGEPKTRLVDGGLDVKMQDIMNNYFLRDNLTDELDIQNFQTDPTNPEEESVALQKILNTSYDTYVKQEVKKATNTTPDGLRKAKREASHEWYKRKVKQIIQEQQITLAKAFGLDFYTNNDGSIELRGLEEYQEGNNLTTKQLRIKFVQNLNYDPMEDERRILFGDMPLDENFKETDQNHDMYVADAVIDSIHEDMFTAKNGLMYISLNNGSAATVNKVLAYHYIMSYYDSDLVQSSLESIEPKSNGKSQMYRVAKLVEHLTSVGNKDAQGSSILDKFFANNKELTTDQVKQAEFFQNFWNEFDELNDQVINKGVRSTEARRKILSTLAAAIIVNSKNNDRVAVGRSMIDQRIPMDFYFRYMPSSKEKLRQQENKHQAFLNSLKTAYENRHERSEKQTDDQINKNAIKRMMLALQDLKSYNYTNIKDVENAIITFLENAGIEIYDAIQTLESINTDPYDSNAENVNEIAKKVSSTYSDVIGFYKSLLEELNEIVRTNDKLNTVDVKRFKTSVINDLNTLEGIYREKLSETAYRVVDLYIDQYWGDDLVTPAQKQNMKANAHAYLRNQAMNGDIASYETIITMNNYSRSPICKIVINAIQRLNRKREQRMREKATELSNLLNKTKKDLLKSGKLQTMLLGNNFQRIFQELDELGIPTGNFVRPLNYGKFYKLRTAEITRIVSDIEKEIRNELGDITFTLELDKHGHPIFPEDDFFEKYWKEYQLKLNHFDCTHAEKMYTEDYYKIRIQMLSRRTINAMNDVQDKIDIILTPVMQEGIPHPERLSHEDLVELFRLQIQQETLSSRYDIFGHKKTGDDLAIANEILAFRDVVKGGREFKASQSKYDEVTKNMTTQEKSTFDAFMTSWQIQPEYWDMYNKLKEEYRAQFPSQFDATFARMDEINKERREILQYFQGRHYYEANIENMSDDAFARIRDLDIEYSDLCTDLNNYLSTLKDPIESPFSQIGDSALIELPPNQYVNYTNGVFTTKFAKFIDDAIQKDKQESQQYGVPTSHNYFEALALYTVEFVDSNGNVKRRPTSAFSYFKPKNLIKSSLIQKFGVDPTKLVKIQPNKSFNELVGGIYMNPNYDPNNPERLQPKEKNPQYKYIQDNEPLRNLYYALLDTMSESNSMIPNTRNNSNFRLPQIGASSMTVFSRNHVYNPIPGVSYMLDRTFNVNESDTEINDDFYTLPDGTRINSIPLRYTDMLKNPANITADVVGSVIAYYDMAVNFDLKNAAAPTMELLLQQVGQNSQSNGIKFSGRETSQYSKLKNIMESRLYDNEAVWGTNRTQKLSANKKRLFKTQKFLSNVAVRSALSRNFISYTTGFFDAMSRLWSQAIAGDLFRVSDFFKTLGYVMQYIADGHFIGNIGSYLPNNYISALMWRSGLSTGNVESFQGTHKSRFRRSLKDVKTGMAGFRVSDFIINGILTGSVYHNMHYYENNGVGTFLSEREWIPRYLNDNPNSTISEAKKKYNEADEYFHAFNKNRKGIPIYGEIESLSLKSKYNVSQKELNRLDADVSTLLHTQAAKVNGAVYDEDKAGSHQNPVLKTLSSLRNYLINDFQTRWATGDEFQDQDTSIQNINKLKTRRRELKKALSDITKILKQTGKPEYHDAIAEIDDRIQKLEDKIRRTADDSIIFNPEYGKDAIKSMLMGIPVGMTVGSTLAPLSSLLFVGSHGIVFGAATILGGLSAAALSLYNNAVKPNSIKINRKLSLIDQKIALEYIKASLEGGPDAEQIRQEIDALDKRIATLQNLNKINKGYANWALRQKALGYNRAMGSAFTTMMDKLKFFYRTHFVDSWRDLPSIDLQKMKPKLTQQEKIGLRKGLGDISNIVISMIIATILYGWKMDDPDLVLPAKITDATIGSIIGNDRITRNALSKMYEFGDNTLSSLYSTMFNNEPVQGAAQSLYELFQNHNIIPFDDDVFERMIETKLEMILGKKAAVRSKTGEVYYKQIAVQKQLLDLTKSWGALQSLRVWSEIVQPYDPTAVNDYLSTPSATNNVLIKEADASVHLANDAIEGKTDKLTQRGSYTSFTKKQYYEAKSIYRYSGIPTVHEETTPEGLDARFGYTRGLGFGPIIFPKPEQTKSRKQSEIKPRKSKKSNRTLYR